MLDFLNALAGLQPLALIVGAVIAYFAGNINGAILIGKAYGIDVRKEGSGNAGTTNALRSLGKKAGAITFVIDVLKGWAVVFLAPFLLAIILDATIATIEAAGMGASVADAIRQTPGSAQTYALVLGLFVILGHMWPVVFGFRGGKGVATTFGVLLAASPIFALVLFALVIVLTVLFRRVSLSVMFAVVLALVLAFTGVGGIADGIAPLWLIVVLALVVFKHRANIGRLVRGQEPKLSFSKK